MAWAMVLLPEPLGPMRARVWPAEISNRARTGCGERLIRRSTHSGPVVDEVEEVMGCSVCERRP